MKHILLILLSFFSLCAFGQSNRLFTVDKELSNSNINAIYQDRIGVIWIATEDGLDKYDGAKFTIYKHDESNSSSLIDNNVYVLYADNQNHLFVGTSCGLQYYDMATDKFIEIPLRYKNGLNMHARIKSIIQRRNGELLVGTSGHNIFTIHFGNKAPYALQSKLPIPSYFIENLFEDKMQNLWISTDRKGLFRIDYRTNRMHAYFINGKNACEDITQLCQDSQSGIFACSLNGLYKYDSARDLFLKVPNPLISRLPINAIYPIYQDEVFLCTMGYGIKVFNQKTGKIEEGNFKSNAFNFNNSDVQTMLKDRTGNLWLGIRAKGVMVLPAIINNFQYIGYKSLTQNKIGSNSIIAVCKDHSNTLWLGTANDGIYGIKNSNPNSPIHFVHRGASSVPSMVNGFFEDSFHHLWIGSSFDGVAQMNPQNGKCKYLTLIDKKGNIVNNFSSFAEDNQHRLWIGMMGGGLFCLDLKTNHITRMKTFKNGDEYKANINMLHNRWISSLLYTSHHKLYIGTYDGLGCLDLKTMNFVSTYKINRLFLTNYVFALHEDYKGDIWVGTSKGLIQLNEKTGKYKWYTTKEGLPSNTICAIEEDQKHTLWVSTDYGVAHFYPHTGACINYYAGDGLQGNEFNKGASYKDKKGTLIYGGINGVTYFDPMQIKTSVKKLKIRIVDFYIHDKAVTKGMTSGNRQIIDTGVYNASKFHLSYQDNSFSIEFSAMEFYNPERISYIYSMNGGQWISLRLGINKVSFSDLAPGTYHFRVKARDYSAYSEIKEISIIISPPWYESWWAIILYLFIIGVIIYFILMQVKYLHKSQIDEAKLQFLVNISHEIRTPMSLIISPLHQLMASDNNSENQKTYSLIHRNAERILRLVNQLMDVRKIDKGQMRLTFHKTEIVSFINDLCEAFQQQVQNKDISLQFHHEMSSLELWVDPINFDKIIVNLLSNSFKFTPEHGKVDVCLSVIGSEVEIVVSDDGIAIEEIEKDRIFERFYQINNSLNSSHVGTGIGLHLTRSLVELHHGNICVENNSPDPGCRFIIRLPLGCKHLQPEELQSDESFVMPSSAANIPEVEAPLDEDKTSTRSKHYIMVVEDDDEIRKYICRELSNEFYVVECHNGKEALDMILKKTPDLVITDVMMPEMDGLTLCHKIKQNVTINSIPVVFLTAKSSQEDNLEALKEGADTYIIKPFNIEILRQTVENLIKKQEQLRNTFIGNQDQGNKIQKLEMVSPDEKLMKRLMKVINENISNPNLTVDIISTEVGISRVHLYRKMKELTNQSPRDFIRNIRLKQAAALLAEKHHNINEVAAMTGFTSVAYFSSSFHQMFGIPPTKYMGKMLKEKEKLL